MRPNNSSVGWKLLAFNWSIKKHSAGSAPVSEHNSVIHGSKGPKSTMVVGKLIPQ